MRLCKKERFCAFLRVFAFFCACLCFFSQQNGLQKKKQICTHRILQKCAKSVFMQYPLSCTPLCVSPNYVGLGLGVLHPCSWSGVANFSQLVLEATSVVYIPATWITKQRAHPMHHTQGQADCWQQHIHKIENVLAGGGRGAQICTKTK